MSVIFIYIFTNLNTSQIEKEQQIDRIKAEKLIALINDNQLIREKLRDYITRDINAAIEGKAYTTDENGNLVFSTDVVDARVWAMANRNDIDPIKESLNIERDVIKIRKSALEKSFQLVLWSGVVLLVALILLRLAVKFFVANPVKSIVEVSEKFALGDLSVRVPVRSLSQTPDELTRLGWAFNRMASSLEKSLQDIRRREHFQQALIDAIPDGIRVIDEDYNIVLANDAYQKFISNKSTKDSNDPHEKMGKCYFSSHKLDKPCPKNITTCPLLELSEKQQTIKAVQKFKTDTGAELPVEVNAAILRPNEYQKEVFIVESIRDLTKDIRFSHTQKLSSVGMLAAGIAHELRNPLGSIRLILEGIVSKIENNKIEIDEIEKYLKKITEQIVNCASVTEILLKLSRLPSDDLEDVNIISALNEVKTLLDYESKKRGITILSSYPDEDIIIKATESEFRMAMLNLLQNAFNAMPNGGNVNVIVEKSTNAIKISIKDEGTGIDEKNISKIFDPFFSTRTTKDGNGTGIGLTITKSMIERHKGTISVKSKKNVGTTFDVIFPLIAPNEKKD